MTHPPLYTLPFAEVEALGALRETLVSHAGYLISGRDRAFDPRYAFYVWSADVDNAIRTGLLHPDDNPKGAAAPANIKPRGADVVVLNKKGKPFSWSYTALTNFEGCPARYAAEKFFCTVVWVDTPQIIWGNRVHTAGEYTIKGTPVTDTEAFAQVEKYVTAFLRQRALGAEVLAEMEIALTRDLKPVSWFSKDAWFRCKLDVTIIRGVVANLYDYKTGKIKNDPDQLKICAAALSVVRPEIEKYVPKFIWTKDQTVTGCDEINAAEIPGIWEGVLGRVARMEQAWACENFPARPSGLCPWCPIYTACPSAKRR